MDYKIILATLAIIIGFIGILPYIYHLLKSKTKPHVFSWIIWALLSGIAFVAQLFEGGGPGAWSTGALAAMSAFVAILGFIKGGKAYISRADWLCLIAAFIGIILWIVTNNPLSAVVIVTLTDAIGFIPTFRKGYHKPNEETMFTYFTSGLQNLLGIFALSVLNATTVLYPASLVITNALFVSLLLVRRNIIHN